jgi:hypothetical protein
VPEAAHDLPGGERADELPVLRGVQGFQQASQPLLGAGEFLVTGSQDAAGGEDLPEEPGSAGPRCSSSASWVAAVRPAAMSARMAALAPERSQFSAVRGLRAEQIASSTALIAAGTSPIPANSRPTARRRRLHRAHSPFS